MERGCDECSKAMNYWELMAKHSRDIILIIRNSDGRILEASPASFHAYGYSREELLDMSIHDLRAEIGKDSAPEQMAEANSRGTLFETYHKRKDGSGFPVEVNSQGLDFNGTRVLVSVVRDITERKTIEAESEAILNALPYGMVLYDTDGAILRTNPAADSILQYSDDVRDCSLEERTAIRCMSYEDGRRIPMDELPARKALQGEVVQDTVIRLSYPDGSMKWYTCSAAPVGMPDGSIVGAVVSLVDVSRFRELQDQTDRLMRDKDDFLAICSHEMKTPLTVAMAGLDLLRRFSGRLDAAQKEKYMKSVYGSAQHLNALVSDLLDVSRLETGHLTLSQGRFDMKDQLEEAISNFKSTVSSHHIDFTHDSRAAHIYGDCDRLSQVFNNLLSNAVRYSPEGSRIHVSLRVDDTCMEVSIKDHGVGIPNEHVPKLFERYYRGPGNKVTGGMGLGLYVVSQIVKLHEGSITVDSAPGKGSTFTVRLPLCKDAVPGVADGISA